MQIRKFPMALFRLLRANVCRDRHTNFELVQVSWDFQYILKLFFQKFAMILQSWMRTFANSGTGLYQIVEFLKTLKLWKLLCQCALICKYSQSWAITAIKIWIGIDNFSRARQQLNYLELFKLWASFFKNFSFLG